MTVGLQRVEDFLKNVLPQKLKQDLLQLRMVREADLECCAYYHLSVYLRQDSAWKVLARKYSLHTGHFIDLLLFQGAVPRMAIELKWNHVEMSKKDRKSLCSGIKDLHVNRAYFITTLIGNREYSRIKKQELENNCLFEIVIPLPLSGGDLKRWRQNRRKYTSQMEPRKRRRDTG